LSNIPNSNCHSASLAFSIRQTAEAQLQLVGMIRRQRFLRDQRMCFAVPQIPRRRTNQFRDFVRVLELRAVHLMDRARITEKNFRPSFDDACLTGAVGPRNRDCLPAARANQSAQNT